MQKISRREHMTNEEVNARVEEWRYFMKSLKKRRIKLIGHTLRYNSLLKRIMNYRKNGRRKECSWKTNSELLTTNNGGCERAKIQTNDKESRKSGKM